MDNDFLEKSNELLNLLKLLPRWKLCLLKINIKILETSHRSYIYMYYTYTNSLYKLYMQLKTDPEPLYHTHKYDQD